MEEESRLNINQTFFHYTGKLRFFFSLYSYWKLKNLIKKLFKAYEDFI